MPTSLAGKRNSRAGVTLIEMMVVVTIVAVLVGITYPSISSGLDSLRLNSAGDSVVSFLNAALNHADRRQEAVEITISRADNAISALSLSQSFRRTLALPAGVSIAQILPAIPMPDEPERRILLQPGGAVPRVGLLLADQSGHRRTVQVDPITGVPIFEHPE